MARDTSHDVVHLHQIDAMALKDNVSEREVRQAKVRHLAECADCRPDLTDVETDDLAATILAKLDALGVLPKRSMYDAMKDAGVL